MPLGLVVLVKDRIDGAAARAKGEESGVRSTRKSTSRAQASWRVGSCEGEVTVGSAAVNAATAVSGTARAPFCIVVRCWSNYGM
jgi:hypothetical protein